MHQNEELLQIDCSMEKEEGREQNFGTWFPLAFAFQGYKSW